MHQPFIKTGQNLNDNSHFSALSSLLISAKSSPLSRGRWCVILDRSSKHMTCQDNVKKTTNRQIWRMYPCPLKTPRPFLRMFYARALKTFSIFQRLRTFCYNNLLKLRHLREKKKQVNFDQEIKRSTAESLYGEHFRRKISIFGRWWHFRFHILISTIKLKFLHNGINTPLFQENH